MLKKFSYKKLRAVDFLVEVGRIYLSTENDFSKLPSFGEILDKSNLNEEDKQKFLDNLKFRKEVVKVALKLGFFG